MADTLTGGEGNDTYDGGAGVDSLSDTSTTSADVYRFGMGYGIDTITDKGGADRVELGAGITASQLSFAHVGNNLEMSIIGQSDKLIVANWYTASANRIEEFRLADGSIVPTTQVPSLIEGQLQGLVDAMAAFAPEWDDGALGGPMMHIAVPLPQLVGNAMA